METLLCAVTTGNNCSGHGKYKIADRLYDVSEGDIIILNPGQKHQALCTDPANPTTEFFVGLCDVRFPDFPENYLQRRRRRAQAEPWPCPAVAFFRTGR